jgi:lipoprotein-releasing system permease protein
MDVDAPLTPPSADSPFVDQLTNTVRAVDLLRFQGSERANHAQFQIFDWRDKNANHLSVIELQKIVLTIFFFIIVLVGSFVVVGSQIMIINEKTADIAILKTIGATGPFVRLVFTLQGLFVASIGVIVGLAVGLLGVWLLDAVDYQLEASIYFIDRLPVRVDPVALVFVALGALACTLLTTQISAARAAAREPVDGLRQVD